MLMLHAHTPVEVYIFILVFTASFEPLPCHLFTPQMKIVWQVISSCVLSQNISLTLAFVAYILKLGTVFIVPDDFSLRTYQYLAKIESASPEM